MDADDIELNDSFQRAVRTARYFLPIMKRTTKPEYWCEMVIVRRREVTAARRERGLDYYAVYKATAWDEPTEVPILPWSPPHGERVATVDLDGEVTMLNPNKGDD